MDFEPDSGRRLLVVLESIGEQFRALYKVLPTLCEDVAPDWEGDTAEHASEVFRQYGALEKKCSEKMKGAKNRLRNAVKTAEAIDQLFAKKGGA